MAEDEEVSLVPVTIILTAGWEGWERLSLAVAAESAGVVEREDVALVML